MTFKRQETTPGCDSLSYRKFLLKTVATIFVFVQCSIIVDGMIYQSVQWISTNPRFIRGEAEQNCKDDEVLEIRVAVASKMTFICPTKVMVVDTMKHENPQDSLYENLWIVEEKGFDSCTVSVNDSRKLLTCKEPQRLAYETIVFNMFSASDTQLAFAEEKYYYFLSTSDGSYPSLNNTANGHCNDTSTRVAMKFRLFVCKEGSTNPKCNETIFPHGKFRCVSTRNVTQTTTSVPVVSSNSDLPDHSSSSVMPTSALKPDTTTTATEVQSTPTHSLKENSSEAFVKKAQIGSRKMIEKETWMWIALFSIPLNAILLVILGTFVCLKNGKRVTCFSYMTEVSCRTAMKPNRYANKHHDANKNSSSLSGHQNLSYQESFKGDTMSDKIMVTNEESKNGGKINRGFSSEEKKDTDKFDEYKYPTVVSTDIKGEYGYEMNFVMASEKKGNIR